MSAKPCRLPLYHSGRLAVTISFVIVVLLVLLIPLLYKNNSSYGTIVAGLGMDAIIGGIFLIPIIFAIGMGGAAIHNLVVCRKEKTNWDWIGLGLGGGLIAATAVVFQMFIKMH